MSVIATAAATTATWTLRIGGGILLSQMLRKPIQKMSEHFFPFEKSTEKKRIDAQYENQISLEKLSQEHRKELYSLQASISRNTAIAAKDFPLNISPFVVLGNNGFDIKDTPTGKFIAEKVGDVIVPLNIFVNPLLVSGNVSSGSILMGQVWDVVVQKIESIFINEYSRNGERPVRFYSTAWNPNARPGTHTAETIYYFLKYIPTLIIEPRYDGKNIRVIVSGWGLGYDSGNMFRQEINVEWDWNAMISTICYERSKSALSVIEKVCTQKTLVPVLAEKEKILQRNVSVYEDLRISELLNNDEGNRLEALGDYSRLFAIENTDIQHLANAIACAIGMTMVSFADLHYLVIDNIQPLFPTIAEMYFKDLADEKFRETFVPLYKNTYRRLSEECPCMALQMQLEETMFIADLSGRKCITEDELAENIWRYCKSKGVYIEGGGKKLSAALSVLLSLKYTSKLAQKYLLCVEEILQNMNADGRYTSELFNINIIKTDNNINY